MLNHRGFISTGMVPIIGRRPVVAAGGSNLSAMAQLVQTKNPSAGQWFKVNTNVIADVALARTKANFDGGASIGISDTWASDADVALGAGSGGVGGATSIYPSNGFSKAAIDSKTGRVIHPTMGHNDTLDGSGFVIEPGATAWALAWKGGRLVRYEDESHADRLPAWSHQILAASPGNGTDSWQWITVTDVDGNERAHTGHHYAADFIVASTGIYFASMTSGAGTIANSAPGGVWKYNPATGEYTEHWHDSDTTLYSGTELSRDGFVRTNSGFYQAGVYDPVDDSFYFFWNYFFIYRVSNATTTPSVARLQANGANATTYDPNLCPELVIIPNPSDPDGRALFMFRDETDTDKEFVLYSGLSGSDLAETAYVFDNDPSAVLARALSSSDSLCNNETDKRIVMSQGDRDIYKIDYDGITDPADFQLVKMTSSPSGVGGDSDMPPTTQGQCRIAHLKEVSAELGMELYGMVTRGDYFIYRAA